MGKAKRDLAMILDYLNRGYVVVDASKVENIGKHSALLAEGWDAIGVYTNQLETRQKKPDNSKYKPASNRTDWHVSQLEQKKYLEEN